MINVKNRSEGFSLIELMVVLAIVGVLAAIATPVIRTYIIRTKVNRAYSYAMDKWQKYAIEQYHLTGGFSWPDNQYHPTEEIGLIRASWLPAVGGDALEILFDGGTELGELRHYYFQAGLPNRRLFITMPTESSEGIIELGTCITYSIPCEYLPEACQANCNP